MEISAICPIEDHLINVIIETPLGSRNKFDYDQKLKLFRLKKTLPVGSVFPFDFGFVPNTLADDGDPIDVLVIMDQPGFMGCLVQCRAIGIIEAEQKEKGGKKERNDRIVAISACSILYKDIKSVKELNKQMVAEIEHFFMDYNRHEGKEFKPLKWADGDTALKLIKKQTVLE